MVEKWLPSESPIHIGAHIMKGFEKRNSMMKMTHKMGFVSSCMSKTKIRVIPINRIGLVDQE
jgi:hypothetical protein